MKILIHWDFLNLIVSSSAISGAVAVVETRGSSDGNDDAVYDNVKIRRFKPRKD
jgi:hypothetical protein